MNNLKPIRHRDLSRSVRDAIEAAIVECELAPGTHLVDRQIASMLNVSRTPVRDAMRHLEPLGLVRRQGRGATRGWVVSEFRESDVRELFELRRLFEPLGIQRMASKPDEELMKRLSTYFDDFSIPLTRSSYELYIQRDRAFHKEIISNSGNSRVIGFYKIMEKQMDRIRHFLSTGYEGRMDQIGEEHQALCEAIGLGEIDAAVQALQRHLHQGEEAMIVFAHERQLLVEDLRQEQAS